MSQFTLIFTHYLKRAFRHPVNLLIYIALPLGLAALNMLGAVGMVELTEGADAVTETTAMATFLTMLFMVAFQFFSGEQLIYNIFDDLNQGDMRWRLAATPVPKRAFVNGIVAAGWTFNIIQGIVIVGVMALAFGIYWGNLLILVSVFLLVSVMSQLLAALIALLSKTRKTATIVSNIICFGMMLLSGTLFIPLGDSPVAEFVMQYSSPLPIAFRAILYTTPVLDNMNQAIINLGILVAVTVVLAGAVMAVGRRRKA
ncbi:MAG: ABC transporter permease [Oscillospiraceae bacterium]|nr:ABC transporter permease [Oscillospiraceae bacterium]